MKSEKSKVLGALLPSESCHDEFEALYLQYSYDMAKLSTDLHFAADVYICFTI